MRYVIFAILKYDNLDTFDELESRFLTICHWWQFWHYYNFKKFDNPMAHDILKSSWISKYFGILKTRCLKVSKRSLDSVNSVDNVDKVANLANVANFANVDNVAKVDNVDNIDNVEAMFTA